MFHYNRVQSQYSSQYSKNEYYNFIEFETSNLKVWKRNHVFEFCATTYLYLFLFPYNSNCFKHLYRIQWHQISFSLTSIGRKLLSNTPCISKSRCFIQYPRLYFTLKRHLFGAMVFDDFLWKCFEIWMQCFTIHIS